jgi:PAS domain S-box-containing protein
MGARNDSASDDGASDGDVGDDGVGDGGAIAAIAAVLAASPLAQALFRPDGSCAASTPAFARQAEAAADADGRIGAALLAGAGVGAVRLGDRVYQLVTLASASVPVSAAAAGASATAPLMRAALDSIPAAITIKDGAGRFIFTNAYQAELWGIDPGAALGLTTAELRGDQSAHGLEMERLAIDTRQATPFYEETHIDVAGAERQWLVTKVPLEDPGTAGAVALLTFAVDISDRKRLEAVLLDTKRAAETASQSKTMFLAQVSHELRTPLNAIIGFTEMMVQELFGPLGAPQYVGYAGDVLKAARHLLAIITDMLDVTRLDAGALALDLAPVAPGDIVGEAGRMVALPANTKGVVLRQYIEPGLPPLLADARRLRQALINLIANAVKFTPEGGRVSFGARRIMPDAGSLSGPDGAGDAGGVELYVEDSGIGMSADELAVALLVFGRAREGYAKTQDGTGIGLPLAKALIERHGGRFVIDSVPDRGTKIRAVFPRACLADA